MDVPGINQGSWLSIFRSLPAWEVLYLQSVPRTSSWSPRGCMALLKGVLLVFYIMDAPRIH
jgi:hypothetical protein